MNEPAGSETVRNTLAVGVTDGLVHVHATALPSAVSMGPYMADGALCGELIRDEEHGLFDFLNASAPCEKCEIMRREYEAAVRALRQQWAARWGSDPDI